MPSTWSTYGELAVGSEQEEEDDAWSLDTEFHRNARKRDQSGAQALLVPEIRQGSQPAFQPTFFDADRQQPVDMQRPPVRVLGRSVGGYPRQHVRINSC